MAKPNEIKYLTAIKAEKRPKKYFIRERVIRIKGITYELASPAKAGSQRRISTYPAPLNALRQLQ